MQEDADVTEAMWSKAVTRLRSILELWLCKDSEKPLGGPDEVACLEEVCQRSKSFWQRSSWTWQLGRQPERFFSIDRSQKTLRKRIQKQVVLGSFIFMDSLEIIFLWEGKLPTTCKGVSTIRPENSVVKMHFWEGNYGVS